ncbi:MAG: hypothetical protein LBU60_03765 [Clostridiales bacterium]|jgi:hypothetical protein|nr:hypothetical protein [Clostridiales bacterium]
MNIIKLNKIIIVILTLFCLNLSLVGFSQRQNVDLSRVDSSQNIFKNNSVLVGNGDMDWQTQGNGVGSSSWQSVAYGNDKFIAVASMNGTSRVMSSPNGIDWDYDIATGVDQSSAWLDVTYGDKKFVAVANSGTNLLLNSIAK